MQTLDRAKFVTLNICEDFVDFVKKEVKEGRIPTENGKFSGKATCNAIGILKFPTNGRTASITGLIAGKNGYASLEVFKGTDFYTAGGAFVESILREFTPDFFAAPAPKSPKVSRNEMAEMHDILNDLGI